jgi:hypothetical protein
MKLSEEEWAVFSEKSRRFLVALAARYNELERMLAERQRGDARAEGGAGSGLTLPPAS